MHNALFRKGRTRVQANAHSKCPQVLYRDFVYDFSITKTSEMVQHVKEHSSSPVHVQ